MLPALLVAAGFAAASLFISGCDDEENKEYELDDCLNSNNQETNDNCLEASKYNDYKEDIVGSGKPSAVLYQKLKDTGFKDKDFDQGDLNGKGAGDKKINYWEVLARSRDLLKDLNPPPNFDPGKYNDARKYFLNLSDKYIDYAEKYSEAIFPGMGVCRTYPDDLRKALFINPENDRANFWVGHCEADPNKAEPLLRKGIYFRPKTVEAYNDLGIALYEMGKDKEAIGYLKQALHAEPKDSNQLFNTLINLGFIVADTDEAQAEIYLKDALKIHPNSVKGNVYLAILLEDQGNHLEALRHYKLARMYEGERHAWKFLNAYLKFKEKRIFRFNTNPIIKGNDDLISGKKCEEFCDERYKVDFYKTSLKNKLKTLDGKIKSDPENADLYYQRAIIKAFLREFKMLPSYWDAIKDMKKTVKLNPNWRDSYVILARLQMLEKDTQGAQNLLKSFPDKTKMDEIIFSMVK